MLWQQDNDVDISFCPSTGNYGHIRIGQNQNDIQANSNQSYANFANEGYSIKS